MAYEIPRKSADVLDFLSQIDDEGSRVKQQWDKTWESNVKIMRTNSWPDKSSPLFAVNLISPAVRRKSGLLVESRPVLDVKTRRTGFTRTADVLKEVLKAMWDEQNIPMALEELAFYLAPFGNGWFKVSYDRFADYGNGDICVRVVDPRLLLVDPGVVKSYGTDKAQYIREDSIVPLAWVKKHYPKYANEVDADTNVAMSGADQWKVSWVQRAVNRMFRRTAEGGIESAVPRVWLREYWIADPATNKDGELKYPGGRRILRTGSDIILNPDAENDDPNAQYGQQNPYFDGLWPYECLDNEPDADHLWGHSEIEALKKVNEAFNRVGHTTVSTLIKNLEWVIADANALRPDDLTDLKRLQAIVLEKQPGRSVERVPPTQPTSTSVEFMRLMISLIEMQEGLSDGAMQGKGRVELRSQPQLEGLQQVAQVLIRAQCRRMEAFLERVGQKLISRIFQFYTDDRVMTYVDKDKLKEYSFQKDNLRAELVMQAIELKKQAANEEMTEKINKGEKLVNAVVEPEALEAEDILEAVRGAWRLFRFKIVPFSSLASTRMQRAALLQEFAGQGLIPPSMVLEEAGFDNYADLLKQLKEDVDIRMQLGIPLPQPPQKGKKKGGQQGPPPPPQPPQQG